MTSPAKDKPSCPFCHSFGASPIGFVDGIEGGAPMYSCDSCGKVFPVGVDLTPEVKDSLAAIEEFRDQLVEKVEELEAKDKRCGTCNGTGVVVEYVGDQMMPYEDDCPDCWKPREPEGEDDATP